MRRAARTDENQRAIVDAFRKFGAHVSLMHRIGGGFPDLHICPRNQPDKPFLVEVKDGAKRPSERKLNDRQIDFHADYPGRIEIVTSVDDVARLMGAGE